MSNPLTDAIPDALRKRLYALAFLAALVFTVYQAADGDWKQFVGGLLSALVTLLAASNTSGPLVPDALKPKPKGDAGAMSLDMVALIAVVALVVAALAIFGVRLDR